MAISTVFKAIFFYRILGLLLLLSLAGCTAGNQKDKVLRVATAANMQFPMEQILTDFEAATGISCELITGSSGKLTAQIIAGAPFDLFVSADTSYPNLLYREGKTEGEPIIYAFGQLILVNNRSDVKLPDSLSISTFEQSNKVAMANPATAPYGKAAKTYLERSGLYEQLGPKIVYGESINQTNQFISTGVVDAGITSQSVVHSDRVSLRAMQAWTYLDTAFYDPIAQASVLVKNDRNQNNAALQLQTYLNSSTGQAILEEFGYAPPNQ